MTTNLSSLPEDQPGAVVVRMTGIHKRFPGTVANNGVDFELRRGEVHALLGENGAGKTTLMNVLYGLYHPDAGHIWVHDKEVVFRTPADAIDCGICMVHQTFRLVPTLTVAENVILGLPSARPLLRLTEVCARIEELGTRYKLDIDPCVPVGQLSAGQQQSVEILKALYREAQILILDEPTSVLTPYETQGLFACIEQMAREGLSVVFISHKLGEVFCVSDRITVMRDGARLATVNRADVTQDELACMMVGRDVAFRLSKPDLRPGDVLLDVAGLCATGDNRLPALQDVTLSVRRGEILGIAGVAGNGQSELAEVLTGLRTATAGEIRLNGQAIANRPPHDIIELGVAYVPEKVREQATLGKLSIEENTALKVHDVPPYRRGMFLNQAAIGARADALMRAFDVRAANRRVPAGKLSGGNLHKLILAGELARDPELIVAANPTAGLDVGASEFIRKRLLDERSCGKGVVLISSDLEEIMNLSDRIAVMYRGRIVGEVDAKQATADVMGPLLAGSQPNKPPAAKAPPDVGPTAPAPARKSSQVAEQLAASQKSPPQKASALDLSGLLRWLTDASGWESLFSALAAIVLALVVAAALISVLGVSPLRMYSAMWQAAFGTRNGIGETLVRATPLLLAGLGVVVAFRCGMWNIGAEGQFYAGALGAALAGIVSNTLPPVVHLPLVILAGAVFGGLYAALPGLMRAYRGANEIVTTIMFNYVMIYVVSFLVSGPMRDPTLAMPRPQSTAIAAAARLPKILTGTRAHAGIILALICAVLVFVVLWKTVAGYRIRVVGENAEAARFGGINVKGNLVLAMVLSGALAGIAGMAEVSGVRGYLMDGLSADYGYTAIAVALLGGLHPAAVVVASLFFASLLVGAEGLQRSVGVPSATVMIIQGLVLVFVIGRRVLVGRRRRSNQ